MAIESIAKTLGSGSGIDIGQVVSSLVEATYANKNNQIAARTETLTAQISKAAELKNSISGFSSALASLIAGGSLSTHPTSSKPDILGVARIGNADVTKVNTSIEVRQLAQGQTASTNAFAGGATTSVGTGTLTLTFGTATVSGGSMTAFTAGPAAPITITLDSAHSTLQGAADAINAANAGVTASILTDSSGARLVVKSNTGASEAFELKGSTQLRELDIGRNETGSTINAAAQDAIVAVDGVQAKYPINTISTLVPGVKLDLLSAAVGTKVTIGAKTPATEQKQAVSDFVDTFNELYKVVKDAVNATDGPLRGDPAAKDLLRQMRVLTTQPLLTGAAAGTPTTLADLGVGTQRDGTLKIDTARLRTSRAAIRIRWRRSSPPARACPRRCPTWRRRPVSKDIGLGASEANYNKAQAKLALEKEKIDTATEAMRTRMTQQFAAMDAKVAAYKSTQSFMEQQIKSWNSSD